MIKAIFVIKKLDREKINKVIKLRTNAVFVSHKNLKKDLIRRLQEKNVKVYAEIGIFTNNLCPNNREIRQNRLTEIKDLVNNYQIDGIWLDFIRFPLLWEVKKPRIGKTHICSQCKQIKERTKVVGSFVSETRALINQSDRNIQLGMFSVPWREKDFNGAIKKVIGQDFKKLAKYIDVFSPMVYHKMCGKETKWIHEIVSYMDKITGKPILPIIQTEDKPKKISGEEFKEEVKEAIKKPSQGAIIFFLEDLLKDKDKVQVLSVK